MNEDLFNDFVPKINYHVFRKCGLDWRLRPHLVDFIDITYVIKGKARYIINGDTYDVEAGDLLCISDGMEKEAITDYKDPMRCFSINFYSLYPASKSKPPPFPVYSHIGLRKDIIDLFWELTISWSNQKNGYIVKTRALLMQILCNLSEILIYNTDFKTGDYRINKLIHLITLHYPDKLTVKHLAKQINLNEAYLGRVFKQITGMSLKQYIMQVRIRNAENMLQTGNYKVYEVAEHCGFSDVVHFYKSFRELRGFSPSKCISRNNPPE